MHSRLQPAIVLVWLAHFSFSQVSEDFSDGDFLNDPVWSGNTPAFVVDAGKLRSNNDPDAGGLNTYYLSTPSMASYDASWELFIDLQFSTSGANYVDIFLMSDEEDLSIVQNGYFIRIGDTQDEIVLYKILGGAISVLVDNAEGIVNSSSSNPFRIRVTRDINDFWTLDIDDGDLGTFVTSGTATDGSVTSGDHFGIRIQQSSANAAVNGHFFDDFMVTGTITPDTSPPVIDAVIANADTAVDVIFSEEVDEVSAETLMNYQIDNDIEIVSAERDDADLKVVHLATSPLTNGDSFLITIQNVDDLSGNTIASGSTFPFEFLILGIAGYRDVVINEFMADPSPSMGLPEADFVEVFNPTDSFFSLENWIITDNANPSDGFSSFTIRPDAFLILCDVADTSLFQPFGDVLGVGNFPNFNASSGDSVVLSNETGQQIDGIYYEEATDGVTLEQVDPKAICSDITNFLDSESSQGGTPGDLNSVYRDDPDTLPPLVVGLVVFDEDSIVVEFSEPVDSSSVDPGSVILNNVTVDSVYFIGLRFIGIKPSLSLISENNYSLRVEDLSDCEGNTSSPDTQFYYDTSSPQLESIFPVSSSVLSLIFNEPLSESEAETESNFFIGDLSVKSSGGAQLQDSARNRIHVEIDSVFTEGQLYEVSILNIEDTSANAFDSLHASFLYDQDIASVEVMTPNVVQVVFHKVPDPQTATNPLNFLIEDIGKPIDIISDQSQQTVIRVVLSENLNDNQDYILFAEGITDTSGMPLITPAVKFVFDTKAPQLAMTRIISDTSLTLEFDEALESVSAINLNNYHINDERPLEVLLQTSNSVLLKFSNMFPEEEVFTVSYINIEDQKGNAITSEKKVELVYDVIAPRLDTVYHLEGNVLRLVATEHLDLTEATFSFNGMLSSGWSILGPDSTVVDVTWTDLQHDKEGLLLISGWADRHTNVLVDTITKIVDTGNPHISEVLPVGDHEVLVRFSQSMDSSALESSNYTLENHTILSVIESEWKYLLQFDSMLLDGEVYELVIADLTSSDGQPVASQSVFFAYSSFVRTIRVLDSVNIEIEFTTEFDVFDPEWITGIPNIAAVSIDTDDAKLIRILSLSTFPADTTLHLGFSTIVDRWGRRIPDQSVPFFRDTRPPEILDITGDYFSSISLQFNEEIDLSLSTSLNQYFILGVGFPHQISIIGAAELILDFEDLPIDESLLLVYQNIADVAGNYSQSDSLSFTYQIPATPALGEVILSEIMADPTPAAGLPEAEYIELYNVSATSYNLRSLKFMDERDTVLLPDYFLDADSYVVISSSEEIGGLLVPDFPGLNNEGESLTLLNVFDQVIDEVPYERSWHNDTDKEDGGYSLELINPGSTCPAYINWSSSQSESGGTPGAQNSIFNPAPDGDPPVIVGLELHSDNHLEIRFNEPVDSTHFSTITVNTDTMTRINFQEDHVVGVDLDPSLETGQLYQLQVTGIEDCSGNEMTPFVQQIGVGASPNFNELLITEIMADPDPPVGLPNAEYLELLNAGDRLISLATIVIADESNQSGPLFGVLAPGDYALLTPSSSEPLFEAAHVIPVSNWVTLTNSGNYISLVSDTEIIFSMTYSEQWHEEEDKRSGGFSLENGDLSNKCSGFPTWQTSTAPEGGTPGEPNAFRISVPDNFGPEVLAIEVTAEDSLRIEFDEHLFPLKFGTVAIEGLEVDTLLYNFRRPNSILARTTSSMTFNEEYGITIGGFQDCNGNIANDYNGTFIRPMEPGPGLLISEILFDPYPGGEDFVELYNSSENYYDLSSLILKGQDEIRALVQLYVIEPKGYRVLTKDLEQLKELYPTTREGNVIKISQLPPLPNEQGYFVIRTTTGQLDSVHYQSSFHSPLLSDTEGVSLERISFSTPATHQNNWISGSGLDGFATPGYRRNEITTTTKSKDPISIEPKLFIPGSPIFGKDPFTRIQFDFGVQGLFANVDIYNQNGQHVVNLAKGTSIPDTGFIKWEGTDKKGQRVRIGHYIILFEVYGVGGEHKIYRETVVVGMDF